MLRILRQMVSRSVPDLERLIDEDPTRAASELRAHEHRIGPAEVSRLWDLLRRKLTGQEHDDYLARALAEGTIGPTAALELLETYREAGYLAPERAEMHRRHAVEAHRRELITLMARPDTGRFEYFQLLDSYRAGGYLADEELQELTEIVEAKLNPEAAARRLFARALVAVDPEVQTELLRRYLMRFQGSADYPHAASMYLSLRIDAQWRRLPQVASARQATLEVQELNSLLASYLPHTSDLSEYVPIREIVDDFHEHAQEFDPEPGADDVITLDDVDRKVVVIRKREGAEGSYRHDRNRLIEMGTTGRVQAVGERHVLVLHSGPGFTYSQTWSLPPLAGTRLVSIPRDSELALWAQDEIGLMHPRRPSPVFVHQYRAAVKAMGRYLDAHREDRSIRLVGPASAEVTSSD